MSIHVNVDNFVRAETHRMFRDIQASAGGIGIFRHNRTPARIDEQTVIRLNRDTLYSFAIVDLAEPARLTLPDADGRYVSAMIVNEDHFVNDVLHDPGDYPLTSDRYGSRYVLVGVRILVDPTDDADVAAVGAIQDRLAIDAGSAQAFVMPDYDLESLDATRGALLALAGGLKNFERTFGKRDEVDPVRHLIGCAAGWGGLPTSEAAYIGVAPNLPPGDYELVFDDVPVDAFWSVSVYNRRGFFEPNQKDLYTVNSVTGQRSADGSITVRFVASAEGESPPNAIVTPEGWNYLIRLYRPRAEVLDGRWSPPALTPRGPRGVKVGRGR
ncbi:carboxylesterase [Mycobacterium sp. 1554424.7]|nr:carboxylesterase [Mycobacterium sp. 1554424.7]